MLLKCDWPQETRTYFVTAVTAQRRSLFQVTANAELFQRAILEYPSEMTQASFRTLIDESAAIRPE
jgi:hypothetical protein